MDAEKRGRGHEIDVVSCAELFDRVNNEFLNQIGAVSDAGDEGRAGNCNSTKWEPRADRANKKRSHADGDEWKLPDAGRDGEVFGFAKIQCVSDQAERGQPKPRRTVGQALPPVRSKFLDRRQNNAENERIESGPGWIINPRLKAAERYAAAIN